MDPLEKAIRHHLERYLGGESSLNEFQDWLVNTTWPMEETASPATVQLAYAIELVLAERLSGFLTPEQPRADLLEIPASADATEAAIGA